MQSGTCQLTTKSPYYLNRRNKFNLICKFTKDTSILQGCRGEWHFPDQSECPWHLAGFFHCRLNTRNSWLLSMSKVKQLSGRTANWKGQENHILRSGREAVATILGCLKEEVSQLPFSQAERYPDQHPQQAATAHLCCVPGQQGASKGQAMQEATFQH